MGGAYVAVADDGFGSSFNPAGVIQLKNSTFSAGYRHMDLDRRLSFVSYHQQIKGGAAIGGYWINSGVGDVETRDDNGEVEAMWLQQTMPVSKKTGQESSPEGTPVNLQPYLGVYSFPAANIEIRVSNNNGELYLSDPYTNSDTRLDLN